MSFGRRSKFSFAIEYVDSFLWDGVILFLGMDEAAKRKSCGGIAYEVIIKPASGEIPHPPTSPNKEKPSISQEDIDRKLKEAEERRKVMMMMTMISVVVDVDPNTSMVVVMC